MPNLFSLSKTPPYYRTEFTQYANAERLGCLPLAIEAAAQVAGRESSLAVAMTNKKNGDRRCRSISMLSNEKAFRSSGDDLQSMQLLFGLQTDLHSFPIKTRMPTFTSSKRSAFFIINLAASFHFLLLMCFTGNASYGLHTFCE